MKKPAFVVNSPGGDPLKKLGRFEQAVYLGSADAITTICLLTKSQAQTALRDLGRVDRGTLRNSIFVTVERLARMVRGTVSADAFYAQWVEFGRRGRIASPPGMAAESATAAWPPPAVLAAWVSRNLAKFKKSGQKTPSVDSLAYLVGRKIALYGIAPSPFMRPAYAVARPRFQSVLVAAVLARRASLGV